MAFLERRFSRLKAMATRGFYSPQHLVGHDIMIVRTLWLQAVFTKLHLSIMANIGFRAFLVAEIPVHSVFTYHLLFTAVTSGVQVSLPSMKSPSKPQKAFFFGCIFSI